MTNRQALLLIAAFITLTLGSFIWFIATWDADQEQPIGMNAPSATHFVIILPKILPPEAPALQERATL